jgi:hypothetical protein
LPIRLDGSCRCGAVRFSVSSHTPHPYQLCYCTICRKTAGGGGYAINLMALSGTLAITGKEALAIYQAQIEEQGQDGVCRLQTSPDPRWPELMHPFASAIDSELPVPPERVHLMLRYKAGWVQPAFGPRDLRFEDYPEQSIEDWHRSRGLWVE